VSSILNLDLADPILDVDNYLACQTTIHIPPTC
jgi:hypothetical protein